MNKDDGRMLHIQISVVGSYLNIMVVSTRNDNVCYNCNLNEKDLGNINEGFKQYKGIYEIYKGLNSNDLYEISKCQEMISYIDNLLLNQEPFCFWKTEKEYGQAVNLFNDKKKWAELTKKVMETDFSWSLSADKYLELYKTLMQE
jgi:hypothetical protein